MKSTMASDALKLTTSKFISMLISMITAMLLARFLTLEEYGTYAQLLLVTNIVSTLFMLGLPNSINYFLASATNDEEKQKFLSVYYTFSTLLSVFTGIVLIISTPLIVKYFGNPLIKNFMYILAILPWAKIILSSIENVLIIYNKANQIMAFRIINSLLLLVIIFIIEAFGFGFSVYMFLFILIESLLAICVYIIVKKATKKLSFNCDKALIRRILLFSVPIGLASVIGVLSIELDKLMISRFFTTEQVAIYTNAARELPITIISSSLAVVLMPQLVKLLKSNRKEEAINLWGSSIVISYSVICFFAMGLIVFASEAITLLYSDKYLPGVTIFRIYSLVLLLRFTYFGIVLNSIGKTKFILYSSLAALMLNLILSYTFYYFFGFVGPAIATLVSIFLIGFLQILTTGRSLGIPLNKVFPWKKLRNITLINILLGLSFAYIKVIIPLEIIIGDILESVSLGFLWGGIYFLIQLKTIKKNWFILSSDISNLTVSK